MRVIVALAVAMVSVAAPAQVAKDWRLTVSAPTGGSFAVGNPAAKVKLVEYLSFTCPHCGHFVSESQAALHDGFVRTGSVRVETRAAVRDPYDLAAWMLARCGGPTRFNKLSQAIFAAQEAWIGTASAYVQANGEKLKTMPQRSQVRTVLDNSGLREIGAKAGVTPAMLNQCFATDAGINALTQSAQQAFNKIKGTPGFEINGTLAADTYDWHSLEPKLRAAGAR